MPQNGIQHLGFRRFSQIKTGIPQETGRNQPHLTFAAPLCQCPLNTFTSSAPTLTLPHSLAENNLTNRGEDMSGVLKLAEALPLSKLQSLKCATQPPNMLAFLVFKAC